MPANLTVAKAAQSPADIVAQPPLQVLPRPMVNADRLDAALTRLTDEPAKVRLAVVRAAAVQADSTVTRREFDMVRVVADSLDCHLPPIAVG